MRIEQIMVAALTGWPGVAPAAGVGGARRGVVNASHPGQTAPAEQTPAKSPYAAIRDTLEISGEARAQLVGQLSEAELSRVRKLKALDSEVRTHEQAHLAAAGPYARGGAKYQYAAGPDGGKYAVGGEVEIDVSPIAGDPQATIRKARVIRAAALAPAKPSAADRSVAAAAAKMEANAQQELAGQQQAHTEEAAAYGARRDSVSVARNPQGTLGTLFDAVA